MAPPQPWLRDVVRVPAQHGSIVDARVARACVHAHLGRRPPRVRHRGSSLGLRLQVPEREIECLNGRAGASDVPAPRTPSPCAARAPDAARVARDEKLAGDAGDNQGSGDRPESGPDQPASSGIVARDEQPRRQPVVNRCGTLSPLSRGRSARREPVSHAGRRPSVQRCCEDRFELHALEIPLECLATTLRCTRIAALASSTSPERMASTMRLCSTTVAFGRPGSGSAWKRERSRIARVASSSRCARGELTAAKNGRHEKPRRGRPGAPCRPCAPPRPARRGSRRAWRGLFVGELRRAADRLDLETGADQHAFAYVLRADQRNEAAALREHIDQSFFREPRDRFVYRCARGSGLDRDIVLAQPRAGRSSSSRMRRRSSR